MPKRIADELIPPGEAAAAERRLRLKRGDEPGLEGPFLDLGEPQGDTTTAQLQEASNLCKSVGWFIDEVGLSTANNQLRDRIGSIGHAVHVAGDDLLALRAQIMRGEIDAAIEERREP